MPDDGDHPENKKTTDEALDPLAQPPLVRPPPRPLNQGALSEETESADETTADDADVDEVSEPPEETPASSEKPVKAAKPGGRFLGFLGFLFGLAGLAGAGYLYYLLIYLSPETELDARFVDLKAEIVAGERSLEDLADRQGQALAEFAAEQKRARDVAADEVLEAVNQVATQAPPSRREWKVAELAYLLRIANHRVLMERDVAGALVLLQAADVILQELDDFSLYQVRAQLADEIRSLESTESNDVQGLFLRLEAVKTEVSEQSVKLPRLEPAATNAAPAPGFLPALWAQIGGYLRFRRFDGGSVRPLLAPEEEVYLELNLRLMLERAQLAALRREQVIYEQSLQTAADWMARYLDMDNAGVLRSLEELESLAGVELEQPLPDVSGSLSALKSLGEA